MSGVHRRTLIVHGVNVQGICTDTCIHCTRCYLNVRSIKSETFAYLMDDTYFLIRLLETTHVSILYEGYRTMINTMSFFPKHETLPSLQ